MFHPAYKPPLRFVLRLRMQKGGGGIFAGHYIWYKKSDIIDFSNPVEDRAKLLYTSSAGLVKNSYYTPRCE